jgi:type VI secretion system protein VasG
LQQDFADWTRVGGVGDAKREKSVPAVHSDDSLLARFAKNMTEDARNGNSIRYCAAIMKST